MVANKKAILRVVCRRIYPKTPTKPKGKHIVFTRKIKTCLVSKTFLVSQSWLAHKIERKLLWASHKQLRPQNYLRKCINLKHSQQSRACKTYLASPIVHPEWLGLSLVGLECLLRGKMP